MVAGRPLNLESRMKLQSGDWVKTDSGETGQVLHISKLTVFVVLPNPPKEDRVEAFLESELTKIDPPDHG